MVDGQKRRETIGRTTEYKGVGTDEEILTEDAARHRLESEDFVPECLVFSVESPE